MWPFKKIKENLDRSFPQSKKKEEVQTEDDDQEDSKRMLAFGAGNKDGDAKNHKVGFRHSFMSLIIAVVVVMLIGTVISGVLKQKKGGRQEEIGASRVTENFQSPAAALPSDYGGLHQLVNGKPAQQSKEQTTEPKPTVPPISGSGSGLRAPGQPPSILANAPSVPAAPPANANNWMKSGIGFAVAAAQAANQSKPAAGNVTPAAAPASGTNAGSSRIGVVQQSPPNTILAGSVIPVTLITGINSDVPGDVVAQVRQDVYDTVTGSKLLIPQGSRLIGVYDGNTKNGQSRIGVAFIRIIFPDGNYVEIDKQRGTDSSGYPGLADQVNNHTGKLVSAGVMTSLLSAAAQIAAGNTNTSTNSTFGQLAVQGAATNIMNAGGELLKRDMQVTPTISIRPGMQFSVFINKDLTLPGYEN